MSKKSKPDPLVATLGLIILVLVGMLVVSSTASNSTSPTGTGVNIPLDTTGTTGSTGAPNNYSPQQAQTLAPSQLGNLNL